MDGKVHGVQEHVHSYTTFVPASARLGLCVVCVCVYLINIHQRAIFKINEWFQ